MEHDVTEMIYPRTISDSFDENNHKIVTKFENVLFNTEVNALKHDYHIFTYRNVMLAFILQHNRALYGISREANMIKVSL